MWLMRCVCARLGASKGATERMCANVCVSLCALSAYPEVADCHDAVVLFKAFTFRTDASPSCVSSPSPSLALLPPSAVRLSLLAPVSFQFSLSFILF